MVVRKACRQCRWSLALVGVMGLFIGVRAHNIHRVRVATSPAAGAADDVPVVYPNPFALRFY